MFLLTKSLLCNSMMASVMNSVLLQSSLEKMGVQARLQTSIAVEGVGEPYNRQRATRHLDKGRVVIFGGIGATLGNPLLSSDASAALRAIDSITPFLHHLSYSFVQWLKLTGPNLRSLVHIIS